MMSLKTDTAAARAAKALSAGGPDQIVYVRALRDGELPDGAQIPEGAATIYAIHDGAKGARLALTDDRDLAFRLARQHAKIPVSVH